MENGKRNTIVLTIIAIATLVVAVVGATFAYYSVETRDTTSKTTFTGTNNPIGAITLTTPVTDLQMTITPTDMSGTFTQKKFYALVPGTATEAPSTSVGQYAKSKKKHEIAKASLVGGNNETAYTCTAKLNVTTSGEMASALLSGDAFLYLEAANATIEGSSNLTTLDLSTIKNATKTYNIVYRVNGLTESNKLAHIYADIELNNTEKDQSYLAGALSPDKTRPGSTLIVNITSTEFKCTIDNQKATA